MRHMTLAPVIALLLTLPTEAEQTHDLRGPVAEAGTTTITSIQATGVVSPLIRTRDHRGEVSVNAGGREGKELRRVLEVSVLETADGKPTHFSTHYSKSIEERGVSLYETEAMSWSEDTSLQGQKRTYKQAEKVWTASEAGKTEVIKHAPEFDPRVIYPDAPVAVGHAWEADPREIPGPLREAMLPQGRFKGNIQFKFKSIEQTDAGPVAVITYTIDSKYFKEHTNRINQTHTTGEYIKGSGEIKRNLTTHLDTIEFKGQVDTLDGTVYNNQGLSFVTECDMPYTIKSSQQRLITDQGGK